MLKAVKFQDYWAQIKPYVVDLCSYSDILPEDVYALLKYNHATLFIEEDVFLILQELQDSNGDKKLHVYMSAALKNTTESLLHKYQEEVDELARNIGAKKITFDTDRKGFERSLPPGWKLRYAFERSV